MEALTRGRRTPGDGAAHREARIELSQWLVAGREARNLSREQVAQITRIQLRTIEHLEEGRFESLPADVFVRGFIRGYARCVGLSVDDALARYGTCGFAAAPVASAQAQALLDSMAPLTTSLTTSLTPSRATSAVRTGPLARAPRILGEDGNGDDDVGAARPAAAPVAVSAPTPSKIPAASSPAITVPAVIAVAPVAVVEPVPVAVAVEAVPVSVEAAAVEPARKRKRKVTASLGPAVRDSRGRFVRRTGEMSAQMPAIDAAELAALGFETDAIEVSASSSAELVIPIEVVAAEAPAEPIAAMAVEPIPYEAADLEAVLAEPAIIPFGTRVTARARAIPPRTSGILVPPTLVIDDDDPEDAERAREERLAPGGSKREADKGWRSFLPPALLDQQKGRQGGLTLAVIILLIVATLTLSYLMRRPSSTGEGITARSAPALLVG